MKSDKSLDNTFYSSPALIFLKSDPDLLGGVGGGSTPWENYSLVSTPPPQDLGTPWNNLDKLKMKVGKYVHLPKMNVKFS